eukprot:scaffold347_cov380-Prasinococcus_capsulatus_cf.AAC.34
MSSRPIVSLASQGDKPTEARTEKPASKQQTMATDRQLITFAPPLLLEPGPRTSNPLPLALFCAPFVRLSMR